MRAEEVLGEIAPRGWARVPARRAFANAVERARDDDLQLSASQRLGVVPQAQLIEAEEQKYMLALSGTDNFKHVEPDDFVISLRSFEGGFEHSSYRGCVSPAYTVLRPRKALHAGYFRHLFKSEVFRQMLAAFNVGVRDGKSIRYEDFAAFQLPLPPVERQREIAQYLDRETARIDALIEKKTRFIELLREKRQALITAAVTRGLDPDAPRKESGIAWLGSIPAHWQVVALKHRWSVTDCKHLTAQFVDDGIPLASIREVQGRYVELANAKQTTEDFYAQLVEGERDPRPGDLIFSRNATVGAVAQVPAGMPRFAMGQDVCLLRRKDRRESPDFLQAALGSTAVAEQLRLVMVAGWLESRVGRIDDLARRVEASIDLLRERRAALITAAVTGQIDVRTLADAETALPP